MSGLTAKQEDFALHYVLTGSQTKAYRAAYNCENMLNSTIHRQAFELARNPKIAARIRELVSSQADNLIANICERQQFLTTTMRDPDQDINARLTACRELSKSQGDYLPASPEDKQGHGVMIVPVFGNGSLDDWEAMAVQQQRQLKQTVRD